MNSIIIHSRKKTRKNFIFLITCGYLQLIPQQSYTLDSKEKQTLELNINTQSTNIKSNNTRANNIKISQPFNIIGTDAATIFLITVCIVAGITLTLGYNQISADIKATHKNLENFNVIANNIAITQKNLLSNQKTLACYITHPQYQEECNEFICDTSPNRRILDVIDENDEYNMQQTQIHPSLSGLTMIGSIVFYNAIIFFVLGVTLAGQYAIKKYKQYFEKK